MKKGLKPSQASTPLIDFNRLREYLSCGQLGLDLVHDASKSGLVVHGDVRQHFTVDFNGSLFQAVCELAVCQTAFTGRCVDTRDPQLTEHTFLGTTVTVCILTGLHHRLFSDAEDITAATAETFGQGQYFFVTGSCRNTTFYARHIFSLFVSELQASRWQHLCHVTHVGLMHAYWATEVTFVLGCLLRQDVTLEGLTAFNGTTRTNTEALFGAAFGLHFGHLTAPYFVLVRRLQTPCSLVGPEPLLISNSPKCFAV
jgi:hypothetical protein